MSMIPLIEPENVTVRTAEVVGGEDDGKEVACLEFELDYEAVYEQLKDYDGGTVCLLHLPLDLRVVNKIQRHFLNLQAKWAMQAKEEEKRRKRESSEQ